ncbi:hypothetical protein [Halothiobacillus neapolitanus]|uniref:Uncharacterized protein n=1 Tax=Halothiobacillus neapolitanus (strain ATCC 23641 / DSM 15147 / CIP 104769 / NCIMB 8539 / c2) TaxID=555778 RepID=D0L1H4_HALNC|nr:hypothetical protein [Halothiobacillus neapolitanus]ACX96547.1 hypothetical protein Hneap_1724 [Halothiobacillus neapolitanus c2]TDN65341.1 hypothetical protein C8D83_102414 [Halothiobacillus neapolitanus]
MRIQRSTFDFLMISAILGSIALVTSYFGYGAGTLVILFWVLVILSRLKKSKNTDSVQESTRGHTDQSTNQSTGDRNPARSDAGKDNDSDGGGD